MAKQGETLHNIEKTMRSWIEQQLPIYAEMEPGQIVTNTQQIAPMPVITGAAAYPEHLVERMRAAGARVLAADFLSIAEAAGSARAVNVALLGALSVHFDAIPLECWLQALDASVPPRFLALNRKAFLLGREAQLDG